MDQGTLEHHHLYAKYIEYYQQLFILNFQFISNNEHAFEVILGSQDFASISMHQRMEWHEQLGPMQVKRQSCYRNLRKA